MQKKNLTILVFIFLVFSMCFLGIIAKSKDQEKKEETDSFKDISFTYYDEGIPGSKYEIKISKNNVSVFETNFCTFVDCVEETKNENYEYSEENIKKLRTFIANNSIFKEDKNLEIYKSDLNEYQEKIITSITYGEYYFETSIEDYKYKIEYEKENGTWYIVYLKEDNSILVKKLKEKDYEIVDVTTYSLNFSKENKKIILDYVKKELADDKDTIYKYANLKKDEVSIFKSIVENDESYLKNYEDEAKLLYTISYNGINCFTPVLYLYSDNTYEYYDKMSFNNEKLEPKTGEYNYDMDLLIANAGNYEEDVLGPYYITLENGKTYVTYSSNTELRELLTSLDVVLEKCLESD